MGFRSRQMGLTRWKPNPEYDHALVIVRIDGFHRDADLMQEPEVLVTVKKVIWSHAFAEAEVERLNGLRAGSEIIYFWTIARVEKRDA